MARLPDTQESKPEQPPVPERVRDNQRFSVSANRGRARHHIRYVETGGATVDLGDCTFCQATPVPDDGPE